jgi:hypothetical protein
MSQVCFSLSVFSFLPVDSWHSSRAANQVNPCSRIEAFLVLCAEALTPTHNLPTCAGHIFRRFRAANTTKYVYFTADKCTHMM